MITNDAKIAKKVWETPELINVEALEAASATTGPGGDGFFGTGGTDTSVS